MPHLYAQGDILIERIDTIASITGIVTHAATDGSVTVAEGEATGHRHRLIGSAVMYRDDALARDIPSGLYVAHIRVDGADARLEHEEHGPITLPAGNYRIRRQRQLDPMDVGLRDQTGPVED